MKKMRFFLVAAIATMLVFSACETEDLSAPMITLEGEAEIDIILGGDAFLDPGATAFDEEDGDLTNNIIVTGEVDETMIGTYELVYNVSDQAGNKAVPVKRIVNVIVEQDTYLGTWSVNEVITGDNPDPNWNYTATITASANETRLLIANFGGFTTNFVANVDFDKFGNFTIPNQPLTGSGFTGTMEGMGTTSDDGMTLTIEYDVDYADGDKDKGVGTWTKSK
jgi:hypothetical protein